jgi:hypothetical protein
MAHGKTLFVVGNVSFCVCVQKPNFTNDKGEQFPLSSPQLDLAMLEVSIKCLAQGAKPTVPWEMGEVKPDSIPVYGTLSVSEGKEEI